jgi:hypothetical protein
MSTSIEEAVSQAAKEFLPLEEVVGVSHANGRIVFYVEREKDKAKISSSYKGFPVEVRVIGRIKSL